MMNGAMILVIRIVVNLVFTDSQTLALTDVVGKGSGFLKPLVSNLAEHFQTLQLQVPGSRKGLLLAIMAVPAVMLVRTIFGYLNLYLMNWAALRAVADLRAALFAHLQNLSLVFFSQARTGDLISRITSDTQVLQVIISNSIASIVKDPITVAVLLAISFYQQPQLTLVSLIVLPICLVPLNIYAQKAKKSARFCPGE
jgi:ABC-type multidrug transport system fused ATPase/permease subunit